MAAQPGEIHRFSAEDLIAGRVPTGFFRDGVTALSPRWAHWYAGWYWFSGDEWVGPLDSRAQAEHEVRAFVEARVEGGGVR